MVLTQTMAMLVDAYRELNSRKMFWITLVLSGIVVAGIACVGIDKNGLTVLWWSFPLDLFNTTYLSAAAFYKQVFLTLGFNIWLSWVATILALISTASIIPEFVTGGSIELSLSKPIARLRLFLTKCMAGLLFVGLQVSVFAVASFLVIGLRGGDWEWAIFYSIPLVLLFFSYLYCVGVLVGLLTRSTIAALLLTLLFWFVLFVLHAGEQGVLSFKLRNEQALAEIDRQVAALPATIEKTQARITDLGTPPAQESDDDRAKREGRIATLQASLAGLQLRLNNEKAKRPEYESTLSTLTKWHTGLFAVKTLLPKTTETMALLERRLVPMDDFARLREAQDERRSERRREREERRSARDPDVPSVEAGNGDGGGNFETEVSRRQQEIVRSRSVLWVIGTSLAFQLVVLGIACWIFTRRDF